ncbi:hypothetical protein [Chitinophaga varians]|uniref:hypothetical protein n=1 Tax=Chitinophaga varians TaxID=2202339 RepID=UPI00165FB787|nr:hypothetical protein [Chitinophaga varians]MBC9909348.1 hypothetical protein [Chitinophaga varians]
MYSKTSSSKIAAVRYSMLLCFVMATHLLRAQESPDTLEVRKITFTSTEKTAAGKKPSAGMTVYYHPDYLYATQTQSDGSATSWLLWHHAGRLLKIEGQQGLPLNYGLQLKTNVYLPGEAIDSSTTTEKAGNDGDWDNANEYNGPGYGKINFTNDTTTIAGYPCKKAVIHYVYPPQCADGLIRSITIWYNAELPPFFLPPFTCLQKIPGAALMMMVETFDGATDGYKATAVEKQQKTISFFRPSKDIRILYPPKL